MAKGDDKPMTCREKLLGLYRQTHMVARPSSLGYFAALKDYEASGCNAQYDVTPVTSKYNLSPLSGYMPPGMISDVIQSLGLKVFMNKEKDGNYFWSLLSYRDRAFHYLHSW